MGHMSPNRAGLQRRPFPPTMGPSVRSDRASERVRLRLQEELRAKDISQRTLADRLSDITEETWTQSKVGKVLNGHVELKVDDVDAITKVLGLFISEAVRDRGLEFYAEMTPTELRILERIRRRPEIMQAVMVLLDIPAVTEFAATVPKKRKRGRPLNSEIAKRRA